MKTNDLDQTKREISSVLWRKAIGNPSDERWTHFRSDAGIAKNIRYLTRYEAFLLGLRKNWREVCKDAGIPYKKNPHAIDLVNAGDLLLQKTNSNFLYESTYLYGQSLSADELLTVLNLCLGKPISERTVRRKVGRIYSRTKRYNPQQCQLITELVS